LADLIKHELSKDKEEYQLPPVSEPNDYEVYPEEDTYDRPRNPYSRV
jgi:hypothetical protein